MNNSIIFQAKNQKHRLLPWILYHHFQGFNKFIYFDDFSEDNSIEYIQYISDKYNINIIINHTDNIGTIYNYQQTQDSNTYGGDSLVNFRIIRSYNQGIDILKNYENDYVAFIDVDEFFVTQKDKKISDILLQYNLDQIYVQSYDVKDDYDLSNFYISDLKSKYRWSFIDRQKTMFSQRGKSIIKYNKLKHYLQEAPNVVHSLGNDDYSILDSEILRIHHFRKPCLDYSIEWVEDNTLINISEQVKKNYHV